MSQERFDETNPAGYAYGKAAQWSTKDQLACLHLQPCLFAPAWRLQN